MPSSGFSANMPTQGDTMELPFPVSLLTPITMRFEALTPPLSIVTPQPYMRDPASSAKTANQSSIFSEFDKETSAEDRHALNATE